MDKYSRHMDPLIHFKDFFQECDVLGETYESTMIREYSPSLDGKASQWYKNALYTNNITLNTFWEAFIKVHAKVGAKWRLASNQLRVVEALAIDLKDNLDLP